MKYLLFTIVFFFLSSNFVFAQSDIDTPFLADFRKRLEANDHLPSRQYVFAFGLNICSKKCTKKDIEAINKLAKSGDMAALALYPYFPNQPNVEITDSIKYAADMGEPYHEALNGVSKTNCDDCEKYVLESISRGYFVGYSLAIHYYRENQKKSKLCDLAKQGYKKFGLELISSAYIDINYINKRYALGIIPSCFSLNEFEKMLDDAGDEGKLIRGFKYINDGEYKNAYEIFSKIYKSGDGSKISSNAGYCLGMMYYKGKGVKKSEDKGLFLLQESFDNGVFFQEPPGKIEFPKKLVMESYYSNTCRDIK